MNISEQNKEIFRVVIGMALFFALLFGGMVLGSFFEVYNIGVWP